jgi:HEAT repeat protein
MKNVMTTPESVQSLLNSPDLGDRIRALNQMREIPPATAFAMLPQAVIDSNPRVRYAAVSQLASLGNHDRELTLGLLRDRLGDSEPDVQAAAADSIGALQLTEAFDELQTLYNTTPEWLVKFSIVAALGEMGDIRAFTMLEDALQSDNELMQMAAIGSLGELGGDRAARLLIPQAAIEDSQIRHRVAQALVRMNNPAARPTLETLAQDPVEQIAQEARLGLG